MLMHANAYIVTSTRVRTDEQHTNTQQQHTDLFEHTACPHSLLHTHSPFLPLFLSLSLFHPIRQPCSLPGTPPCRSCQPASKTCNLHSNPLSLLPRALTGRAVMLSGTGSPILHPPPSLQQFCRLLFADIGNEIKGRG